MQSNVKNKEDECPICSEEWNGSEIAPLCAHSYHAKCLVAWMKKHKDCPLCRREVQFVVVLGDKKKIKEDDLAYIVE